MLFFVLFILPLFPVRGCGVSSLVNWETLLALRSELRSDAFPAATIDLNSAILRANLVF